MKPATFSSPQRAWRRAGWVVRWLLVLLMAFDQASSPLHHHHHDSDLDLTVALAAEADDHADDADEDRLDHHDHDRHHLGHSVTALRSQAASFDDLDVASPALPMQVAWTLVFSLPEAGAPAPLWRDPGPPRFSSHRSLPPGSQAPPLHA